jgi:hypothetical protein
MAKITHTFFSNNGTKVVLDLDEEMNLNHSDTANAVNDVIEQRAKQITAQKIQKKFEEDNPGRTFVKGLVGGGGRGLLSLGTAFQDVADIWGYDIPYVPSNQEASDYLRLPKRPLTGIGKTGDFIGNVAGGAGPGFTLAKGLFTTGKTILRRGVKREVLRANNKALLNRLAHVGKGNLVIGGGAAAGSELARSVSPFDEGSTGDIIWNLAGGLVTGHVTGRQLIRMKGGRFFSRGPTRKLKKQLRKTFKGMTQEEFRQMFADGQFAPEALAIDLLPGAKGEVKRRFTDRLRNVKAFSENLSDKLSQIRNNSTVKLNERFRKMVKRYTGEDVGEVSFDQRHVNRVIRESGQTLMDKLLDPILKNKSDSAFNMTWAWSKLQSGLKFAKETTKGRLDIEAASRLKGMKEQRSALTKLLFKWGTKVDINQRVVDNLLDHIDDVMRDSSALGSDSYKLLKNAREELLRPSHKKLSRQAFLDEFQLEEAFGMKTEKDFSLRKGQDNISKVEFVNIKRSPSSPGTLKTSREVSEKLGPGQKVNIEANRRTLETPTRLVDDNAAFQEALNTLGPNGSLKLSRDGRFVIVKSPGTNAGRLWSLQRMIKGRLDALEKLTPGSASEAKGTLSSTLKRLDDIIKQKTTTNQWVDSGIPGQPTLKTITKHDNKHFVDAMTKFEEISRGIDAEYDNILRAHRLKLKEITDQASFGEGKLKQRIDRSNKRFDKNIASIEKQYLDFQAASKFSDENIGGFMQTVLDINNPKQTREFLEALRKVNVSAPAKVLGAIFNMNLNKASVVRVNRLASKGLDFPVDGRTFFKEVAGNPRMRANMLEMVEVVAETLGKTSKDAKQVRTGFEKLLRIIGGEVDLANKPVADLKSSVSLTEKASKHLNGLTERARERNGSFLIEIATSKRGINLMMDLASGRGGLAGRAELMQQIINFTRQTNQKEPEITMKFRMTMDEHGEVTKEPLDSPRISQ